MRSVFVLLTIVAGYCVTVHSKSQGLPILERYRRCEAIVLKLSQAWQRYVRTPIHNEKERQVALDAFLAEHNRTMHFEYEWLGSVLIGDVTNAQLSLLQAILESQRQNLTKTELEMANAIEVYQEAGKQEINILHQKEAQSVAVETAHRHFVSTTALAKTKAKQVLINYEKVGWKKHLQQDIKEQLEKRASAPNLKDLLLDFLRVAYPFREWLVIIYRSDSDLPYRWCIDASPYVHRYLTDKKELFILPSDLERNQEAISNADRHLSSLTGSNWHWVGCDYKAEDVFNELGYHCGSKKHSGALVFPVSSNHLQLTATNYDFVRSRRVRRHFPITCHQYYLAVIMV